MAWSSRVVGPALLVLLSAGCAASTTGPDTIRVRGSVYTDFRVDLPCDAQRPPAELTGVRLTFRDDSGAVVGTAVTAAPVVIELPRGPGTETWAHGGCRFAAPYEVALPRLEAYTANVMPSERSIAEGGGSFTGIEAIPEQSASRADLEASDLVWTFEAPPEFTVP
jgi:hypothetical protein